LFASAIEAAKSRISAAANVFGVIDFMRTSSREMGEEGSQLSCR
jgi:hypothetical protein